jgi:hypothetical protein
MLPYWWVILMGCGKSRTVGVLLGGRTDISDLQQGIHVVFAMQLQYPINEMIV